MALALSRDLAAVQFNQAFYQGKAQPQASQGAVERALGLGEKLEHVGQQVGRHANAGILDQDFHLVIAGLQPDRNVPAFRRVLAGIVEKIGHDLRQPHSQSTTYGQPPAVIRPPWRGWTRKGVTMEQQPDTAAQSEESGAVHPDPEKGKEYAPDEEPDTEDLEEPSVEKDPGEEPTAPPAPPEEPSHHAVGIGIVEREDPASAS